MERVSMSLWIKICGVTTVSDAELAVRAGADAVGVNFVPSSKRRIDEATAREIVRAVGARAEVIAVVADFPSDELSALRARLGLASVQLHGSESPEALERLLPAAYRAARIATSADVEEARRFGGSRLLVDAKVPGTLGGTGHTFDWALVTALARERAVVVAGGLTPGNVAAAVAAVRPYGVDTASGVEGDDPRKKDAGKVERFVDAARRSARGLELDSAAGVDYEPEGNP
jgi:phosphoribosylanthranilate isomerase